MSRKLSISFLMALLLVMAISVAAMAAGPGPQNPDAGTGLGIHGTFVDADGDGVCDTYADRIPALDGTGSRWGAQNGGQYAQQSNFVDADGDGVCDNCVNGGVPAQDGTGSQMRRGGRNR